MPPRLRAAPVLAVVSSTLLLAACGGGNTDQPQPDNPGGVLISGVDEGRFKGAEPATPYDMPDVTLTATNGRDFNLISDTAYPVTLVFYGYTHCPDICPLVMSDITSAMVQLPDEVRGDTQLVFITTDPSRDTPQVLRDYLDRFNSEFVGLTGDLDLIVRAADDMGVAIEGKKSLPSGGYDVGHGAQVIAFKGDEAPVLWTPGTSVGDIVDDITALAGP